MRHLGTGLRFFAALLLATIAGIAAAQTPQSYPSRAITLVIPFSPGTGADVTGRFIADQLSKEWQVPVVVENRVGANGIIGTGQVARAAPDGYTLLFTASAHLVNAALYKNLPFDSVSNFKPVVRVSDTPSVLVVPPSSPVNSLSELIAYAKARPGQLNYASGGNGSITHLAPALMNSMAGTDIKHIPYKGGSQALTDTMGGQVFMSFTAVATAAPLIKSGKLKAIAVSGLRRSPLLPDTPTMDEAGLKGFDVVSWNGILAPAGTPDDVVGKISSTIVRLARNPAFIDTMIAQGVEVRTLGSEDFSREFGGEADRWAKVVTISGARVD